MTFNQEKILKEVKDVVNSHMVSDQKRKKLNEIEKKYPQDIFIKTNLCSRCNKFNVEVWVKEKLRVLI